MQGGSIKQWVINLYSADLIQLQFKMFQNLIVGRILKKTSEELKKNIQEKKFHEISLRFPPPPPTTKYFRDLPRFSF